MEHTKTNPDSSRSHMVTSIRISIKIKKDFKTLVVKSEIQIVDLAGLESIELSEKSCGGIGNSLLAIKKLLHD